MPAPTINDKGKKTVEADDHYLLQDSEEAEVPVPMELKE